MKIKKLFIASASIIMTAALAACGSSGITADASTVADTISASVSFSETLTKVSANVELKKYGIDEDLVSDAAGYSSTAAVVDEIAVFKTDDTAAVYEKAQAYIAAQKESYTSYAPNEVPKLDSAVIEEIGDYVIVCVSDDTSENVLQVIEGLAE